jgi:hypothetical protein
LKTGESEIDTWSLYLCREKAQRRLDSKSGNLSYIT